MCHLGFGGEALLQLWQVDVADRWQTDGVGVPQAGEITIGGDWDAARRGARQAIGAVDLSVEQWLSVCSLGAIGQL